MSDKKYIKRLWKAVRGIDQFLTEKDIDYSNSGTAYAIRLNTETVNSVKISLNRIIADAFGVIKASKYCKYNFHADILYLQFKKRLA